MFRILPHRALIEPKATVTAVEARQEESTATVRIDGLLCSACASNVQQALERVEGVRAAHVDLDRGEAVVRYDASRAAPDALVRAVEGAVILRPLRRLLAAAHRRIVGRGHQTPNARA